jgi:long-subunit acyl-CoA synthetase (AMP-forming)
MICLKRAIARQQIVQVAIQETVPPREIDHVLQVGPHFVDRRAMIVRETQTLFDLLLELAEDAVDDVVFVAEVVVQIARTDFHFLGDRRRRDVRFADFVEKLQRQFENPFAGAAGRFGFHVVRPW